MYPPSHNPSARQKQLGIHEMALVSIMRTADFLEHELEKLMRAHEITPTQYNVLRILRGALPDGLPCNEIGRRLVNRVPDVTRLLDRIEKQGWITRKRTANDRRLVMIHLTDAGRKRIDELDEPVREMNRKLMGHLSGDELEQLLSLLEQVKSPPQDAT